LQTDIAILGGGPAGYYCALRCAANGLQTVLVEKEALGGTGFRSGCLPVKFILDQIRIHKLASGEPPLSLASLPEAVSRDILKRGKVTADQVSQTMKVRLESAGVQVIEANPTVVSARQLNISGTPLHFKRLVLACGTTPKRPDTDVHTDSIFTHREAVRLDSPPQSLVILGGDVEGLEFASLFSEMGTAVTVLEMLPSFLPGTDRDILHPLWKRLQANGASLHAGAWADNIETVNQSIRVTTNDGTVLHSQHILSTIGRQPALPDGWDTIGLTVNGGRLPVDDQCQTQVKGIYCIGDLNGRMEMAHTAIQQGTFLADSLAHGSSIPWDYQALPRAMFTLPQNAGAGSQEIDLDAAGVVYKKAVVPLADTWRGFNQTAPESYLKLLFAEDETLLGAWVVDYEVSELGNVLALMVESEMNRQQIRNHLWIHPTVAEAALEAALDI